MAVWDSFERAIASLESKMARIERARDNIPFEGTKAINVANILTYFDSVLEEIHNTLNCLKELKDTSIAKGKSVVRIEGTHWTIEEEDSSLVIKRVDPTLTIKISEDAVTLSSRHKDESGVEAILTNTDFLTRKDKVKVESRYNDYEFINANSYYVRYTFKDLAKLINRRLPQLVQDLKIRGVHC